MEKVDENISETQTLLANDVVDVSTSMGDNLELHCVDKTTSQSVMSRIKDNMQGHITPSRESAGAIIRALAWLGFFALIISFIEHKEYRVITGGLVLFFLFSYVSLSLSQQKAVGLNNPEAKKIRFLQVIFLQMMFVISVWLASPSPFREKLYLTAIMLADPITFGVYQVPRLQRNLQQAWQVLVTLNGGLPVFLFKCFAFLFITFYTMRYTSVIAGLHIFWKLFSCFVAIVVTVLFCDINTMTAEGFTPCLRNGNAPRHPFEFFNLQRPGDTELTTGTELHSTSVTSCPAVDAEQNLPSLIKVANQWNAAVIVMSCFFCVACTFITAFCFMALIRAIDSAQSKDLFWFSSDVPQGFFSIVILPSFMIYVDVVLDISKASKQDSEHRGSFWFGFIFVCFMALIMHILFFMVSFFFYPDSLFTALIIVAWSASNLKHYVWEVSRCYELFITAYILLMIWYSIAWATIFNWPAFVTLFLL